MSADPATPVTVYRPNQRHELGFFQTWAVMARNVAHSRHLVWQLFKRDFLATYKKSFIGFTWIFLNPIMGVVSWVFLNLTGILSPGDTGPVPYPVYVLLGMSMWNLFLGFYTAANETLTAGKELVMQVNYPHEALLFKQTAEHLATFSVAFLVNLIVLLAFGLVPSWRIVFFPLVVLPMFFLGAAIGLVASMIAVVAVDLSRLLNTAMGLLWLLTPVVYSDQPSHPVIRGIITYNPLTYLVCSARDIVIHGTLYEPLGYFICSAGALLLFLVSWRLFFVSEHMIVERMI